MTPRVARKPPENARRLRAACAIVACSIACHDGASTPGADDEWVYAASNQVRAYDVKSGREVAHVHLGHWVRALHFSRDGEKLVIAASTGTWTLDTRRHSLAPTPAAEPARADNPPRLSIPAGAPAGVRSVTPLADGHTLLFGTLTQLHLFDRDTGQAVAIEIGHTFHGVALSRDQQTAYLAIPVFRDGGAIARVDLRQRRVTRYIETRELSPFVVAVRPARPPAEPAKH